MIGEGSADAAHNKLVTAIERGLRNYALFLREPGRKSGKRLSEEKSYALLAVQHLKELERRQGGRTINDPDLRAGIIADLERAVRTGDHERIHDLASRKTCALKPTGGRRLSPMKTPVRSRPKRR